MAKTEIIVEVAYCNQQTECLLSLKVPEVSSIQEAIEASGLLKQHQELLNTNLQVGVYGKKRQLTDQVFAHERIEIYRPLKIDPKESRRLKAKKLSAKR